MTSSPRHWPHACDPSTQGVDTRPWVHKRKQANPKKQQWRGQWGRKRKEKDRGNKGQACVEKPRSWLGPCAWKWARSHIVLTQGLPLLWTSLELYKLTLKSFGVGIIISGPRGISKYQGCIPWELHPHNGVTTSECPELNSPFRCQVSSHHYLLHTQVDSVATTALLQEEELGFFQTFLLPPNSYWKFTSCYPLLHSVSLLELSLLATLTSEHKA